MSSRQSSRRHRWVLGLCVLASCAAPARVHAGVRVALTPNIQNVAPGADFDVFVDVTEAGSPFNGFDVVVSFDPAALTLLPLAPSTLQQGCLMTGACSAACGNTFHRFSAAGDSIMVNNVLLCNQTVLTGPGNIYKLRFHASNTPQATQLSIRRAGFFNAGLFVNPVTKSGCMIGIGVTLGVGGPGTAPIARMRVEPNPSRGHVAFVPEGTDAGLTDLEIIDLQGRIIRHLGPVWLGSQAPLVWDGFDSRGSRVPSGVYLVKIRRGDSIQRSRVVLLP